VTALAPRKLLIRIHSSQWPDGEYIYGQKGETLSFIFPWHHNDLQIPFVSDEIRRLSRLYSARIDGHENKLIADLNTPPNVPRRLKRLWLTDLPEPEEDTEINFNPLQD
jgi:hypothetical protein